jgi:endonuclease/exonuclease/phosphatase family metal-dependent hydrolase
MTDPALRNPDILLLQELDGPGADALGRRLGMDYVYVPSAVHPRSHRDLGVAILSRWPVEAPRKVPLPGEHALLHLRRAAAAADVRSPLGALRVYAVHMETPFGASDDTRRQQADALSADASRWPGMLLIGGDFNGTDGARELARHGLTWITRRVHDTAGPFDLDHILSKGLCPADGPAVVRGPSVARVSDHRPVWVVLGPCDPTEAPVTEP